LLYRNDVICAMVCSPVLMRTHCTSSLEQNHSLSRQYASDILAALYQVGEGETAVMVRMMKTKHKIMTVLLWR